MSPTDRTMTRRVFTRGALATGTAGLLAGLGPGAATAAAGELPGGADWMGALSGQTPLARLTVPGTHDTCSLHGGALTETQTLPLAAQLIAGVRFLDIRCRVINGVFAIHHGPVFQQVFFGDVLNACQAFLAAHPRETLLMRVRQEYSTAPDAEFGAIFAGYRDRWPGLLRTEDGVPRLDEVRGRVVLLADHPSLPGIRWGGPLTDIEDDYQIGTVFELDSRKWPEVSAHLDAARAAADPQRLFLTFTSSSGWGLWPHTAADVINPRVAGYASAAGRSGGPAVLGTVPMDFVTEPDVRRLYALNFAG